MSSYYEKFIATGEVKCIDEEIPFEIPVGWEWCRLKHICSMQAGKNISANKIFSDKSDSHSYRCVGGNGLRGYTENFNSHGHYSIIGRQGALCGCVNIEKGKFYATEHAVVVDTYEILSPLFMYYFLTALNLNKYATATAQPGLAVSNVLEVMCPLPPFNEGERIIEKLSLLIPLIENYHVIQEKQDILNDSIKEQLKKSVLQEAIQGKLVPQIAEEGTAQELLEQIKAEKEKLVKEGKLKKFALNDTIIFRGDDNKYYEQMGCEVTEIEPPFDFPSTWSIARLNAVCQLTDGLKTVGKQCLLDARYLRGKSSETIAEQGKLVYKGDNIMLVDGENSGEVFIVPQDGYMGSTFKQLWISFSMYEPYVLAFIQFYKETLHNSKKGAAIPHLNKELFYGLIIGIPPFQEQKRIVQKIELSAQLLK